MQSKTPHISGTFATPAPIGDLLPEEETSGLENIVDWDDLEDELLAGTFASKAKVREYVQAQFDAYNQAQPKGTEPVLLTRNCLEAVIAGLCNLPADTPLTSQNVHQWRSIQVRRIYEALPKVGLFSLVEVKEIRRRYEEEGETATSISRDLGCNLRTVTDIVNYRTWKDAA